MKTSRKYRVGRKSLLSLSIIGAAVGIMIIAIITFNYISFADSGFYYNGVKIGGSTLSHQIDDDIYIIAVAVVLVCSSLFLLIKSLRNKRHQ
ncbi:MAG: hypothetical protein BJBARM4_0332 [Candidatus Parvarchaeum acidiphilum ARMAN-4]|jgi:uncharacterized membrane protein YsdA (DUF1294 family)|uniref:Uncharacterized protein n=2 Tax=Candidatus Parvarchaeum acidiphilum ARMAN-4 TaxID=662760 RepID=D2EF25_PARA4|nr:MAG: hypothetical protein BJBARM4_0332 [Candidatus Parvarchaeum acidiphilum ARMAN-4]